MIRNHLSEHLAYKRNPLCEHIACATHPIGVHSASSVGAQDDNSGEQPQILRLPFPLDKLMVRVRVAQNDIHILTSLRVTNLN